MTKKNFKGGLNSLLGEQLEKPKQGRPRTNFKEVKNKSEVGTIEGEIRATLILKIELLDKIKAVAYWDRLKIKDVVNNAMTDFINKYEKANGEIKPIPKK